MKTKLLSVVAALALFGAAPYAQVDIIEVSFTRTVINGFYSNVALHQLFSISGASFTADFVFDTASMILQTISPGSYQLTGGLTGVASFTIPDLGTFSLQSEELTDKLVVRVRPQSYAEFSQT
jgi:hypothetical protein